MTFLAFGDSLTGPHPRVINFSPSEQQQRRSINEMWVMHLANELRLNLWSYAHSGATAQGPYAISDTVLNPDFLMERAWAGLNPGQCASIWFGTNDYFGALEPTAEVERVINAVIEGAEDLLSRVNVIFLPNLYDLHVTEFAMQFSPEKRVDLGAAIQRHNALLSQYAIAKKRSRVLLIDVQQLVRQFSRRYPLYIDSFHLSFVAQKQIAVTAYKALALSQQANLLGV